MKYPFVHTNNHDYSFFFHRKETLVVHLSGGRQALMWRRKIQFISTSLCLIAKSLPHVVKLLFDWDGYKCGVHLVCSGLAAPSRVSSLWTENITSCLLENCFREQNRMGGEEGTLFPSIQCVSAGKPHILAVAPSIPSGAQSKPVLLLPGW